MIHFGGPTIGLQARVGFGPGGQGGGFLRPVNESGLIAPVKELAHGAAVRAGNHEFLHGCFGTPESDGPKGAIAVIQELNGQVAFGAAGLARGTESVEKK